MTNPVSQNLVSRAAELEFGLPALSWHSIVTYIPQGIFLEWQLLSKPWLRSLWAINTGEVDGEQSLFKITIAVNLCNQPQHLLPFKLLTLFLFFLDQYIEKMLEIKEVMDDVLAKQKAERDDLAKKYR